MKKTLIGLVLVPLLTLSSEGVVFAVTGTTDSEFRRKGLLENSPVLRLLQIGTIPSKVFGQFTFALIKELLMAKTKFQVPSMTIQGENVVGMINASGSAHVNVNQKVIHQATPEMEKLFKRVHKKIKTRSVDPKVAKEKLEDQVKKIETEAAKGETADKTRLERWLKTLAKMAPDIVEVMAASLAGQVSGFYRRLQENRRARQGNLRCILEVVMAQPMPHNPKARTNKSVPRTPRSTPRAAGAASTTIKGENVVGSVEAARQRNGHIQPKYQELHPTFRGCGKASEAKE